MTFNLVTLKEQQTGEKRTAVTPASALKLHQLGADILLEQGAGAAACFADPLYTGCRFAAERAQALSEADLLLAVQPPPPDALRALKQGAVVISFLHGGDTAERLAALRERGITAFAMERIPRISRAQGMDALSSQAALAGYMAVLLGAAQMPRILPMMTTAAGSLRAARVLVMGLGVAGLQALATARRLGAVTEGYDVRPATREEAQSLGAKFIDTGIDARASGGYARELTDAEKAKVAEVLSKHVAEADLIVTAASVPGRAAPRLINAQQIAAMKPGSVIVDIGAESGGNCEGTEPGQTVVRGPATLLGPLNLPSMLAQHASELYAKNLLNLLSLIVKDGAIQIDLSDEIVAATLLTHNGATPEPQTAPAPRS